MEHHHHHHHHSNTPPPPSTSEKHGHGHVADTTPPHAHPPHKAHDEAHDEHAGHHTSDFLKRFWICVAITIPVLLLSHMVQQWLGFTLRFAGDKYLLLAFSSYIFFYGGWPFLEGMVRELRRGNPGMMTLVAVAITTAYLYSSAVVFGLRGMDFFWELATLIDIMLLGHWLEMRSQLGASRALESLIRLLPATVHREQEGRLEDVPLEKLRREDILLVKPGEKVPADGLIIDGNSYVNESMLTGESVPVKKEKDSKVIGGSINGDGILKMRVTAAGENSYLNKVINMVKSAQGAKSRTQNLASKVAMWLTIISLTVGIVTLVAWTTSGQSFPFALERMVTVMVTSCPHALGVAIPLVVAISTSVSAINGLLIRNRTAFENARKISLVIFDKTGTLTEGSHEVQQVIPLNPQFSADELLQLAAAVQQNSEHHIGHGILRKLKQSGLELWNASSFKYIQGVGVEGVVNGKKVTAAGPNYFQQNNLPIPPVPEKVNQSTETVNFIMIDDQPAGIITLADAIRPNAAEAIRDLKRLHIKSFLLTGDNEHIAKAVADELGMDGYLANILPHQKQEKVKEFQGKGEIVAMTGDGVNDAPALAQADVGIAVGSGTDVAAETADIILVNSDPSDVVKMIAFGKATYRKMIQNLVWAVGYNIVAIPLAAGILYPSFVLSPAMGAVLMSLSTVVVAVNAQLLRRGLTITN